MVSKDSLHTRKEFSEIIAQIKKCGKLLHDIILSETNEIRGIKI